MSTDAGEMVGDKEAKIMMHIRTMKSAAEALQYALSQGGAHIDPVEFYAKVQDVLCPYLDSLYGSSVDSQDHTIFTTLTRKLKKPFFGTCATSTCLSRMPSLV